MQDNNPATQVDSYTLIGLTDPDMPGQVCPRRTRIQLDWMLLALEALDLNATENILAGLQELQLKPIIKNRVHLWQLRNTNPLRRFSQRRPLNLAEGKALVALTCYLARHQTGTIRQLLLAHEQLRGQQLTPDHHFRLAQYLERFRGHFFSRMNPNRTAIALYKQNEKLNELALRLLEQVLFCTGTAGMQRLWSSLFDGEVA
ncbi:MAG: DUF3038 domain-containing protein [Thermosynechococcaceae cyanobacterium]